MLIIIQDAIPQKSNKEINKTSEPKIIIVVFIWVEKQLMIFVENVKVYHRQTLDYIIH